MVSSPGDTDEQEADRVSQQVMRISEPQQQRACACGGGCPDCRAERPDQGHERLQTKHLQAASPGGVVAPPIVHEVLAAPGQSLDAGTRRFMEPRFGHDFSDLRLHTDAKAAESAEALGAVCLHLRIPYYLCNRSVSTPHNGRPVPPARTNWHTPFNKATRLRAH